jgi:hypothetical protein
VIAECSCPDPFVRRKEFRKPSFGDCFETGTGNTALATKTGGYRPLLPGDLARAKRVLAAFDVVVPTSRFNHALAPRFILWKAGWLEPCDLKADAARVAAVSGKGFFSFRHTSGFGHEHRSGAPVQGSSRSLPEASIDGGRGADRSNELLRTVPPCILAALSEQNRVEADLFAWAVARFDSQLAAFAALGPNWTCERPTRV